MDPQKLLFLDKRVVRTIRSTGLIFSVSLAIICVLVYLGVFTIDGAYIWACMPLAGALTGLGLLEAFWNPYTQAKVSAYITIYMVIGAPLSVLVLGFSTMIFMGWTLLIMVTVIFFGRRRATAGYILMVLSLVTWLAIHVHDYSAAVMLAYGFSGLAVGILCLLVLNVWRLTNDSVRNMEAAHAKQDYEHNQLTSLINSMADAVIAVDEHAKVILYNAAALNILDINVSLQGKKIGRYMHLVDMNKKPVDITDLIINATAPTVNRDLLLQYKDESTAALYISVAPVHLGYGQSGNHGFVLMMRDISHEKSLEEERDEFISVVSHELRTPIAITEGEISNAQFIVGKTGDKASVNKALDQAHSQVLFLADMINDLSTLSRAERGVLKLEVEDINVTNLLQELLENYRQQAVDKGLELKLGTVQDDMPILHSSTLYVREVLQNFITNAIKYTEKGSVTLSATMQPEGKVAFAVSDTGIGIAKQDQKRVFDKFFRSEDYRTRSTNGTGLGLYVTTKLVHLLHAEVTLESELNKGSTFTVVVPDMTVNKTTTK